MKNSSDGTPELARLIGQLVDEAATDSSRARLAELLRNDQAARAYYLDFVDLHVHLQWEHAENRAEAEEADHVATPAERSTAEISASVDAGGEKAAPMPWIASPEVRLTPLSPAVPPRWPVHWDFSSSLSGAFGVVAVCYLIVAFAVGAALVTAWRWAAPNPSGQSHPDAPVAVISGLIDCRWAKDGTRLAHERCRRSLPVRRFRRATALPWSPACWKSHTTGLGPRSSFKGPPFTRSIQKTAVFLPRGGPPCEW